MSPALLHDERDRRNRTTKAAYLILLSPPSNSIRTLYPAVFDREVPFLEISGCVYEPDKDRHLHERADDSGEG